MSTREQLLIKRYGLTVAAWEGLLRAQNYRCAICGAAEPGGNKAQWHVDHDHDTGQVRGLLCSYCNRRLLPLVEHREELVMKAIAYLQGMV